MLHDQSYEMTEELWAGIKYFEWKEFGILSMDAILIYTLEQLRKYVNRPVIIHSGYRPGGTGYHPKKKAADLHIEGMGVVDQFLTVSRFNNFVGIGIYRWGVHVDTRPMVSGRVATWGCLKKGKYLPLNKEIIKALL